MPRSFIACLVSSVGSSACEKVAASRTTSTSAARITAPRTQSLPAHRAASCPLVGYATSWMNPAPMGTEVGPGAVIAETYRIERKLGEGGMGVVFEAQHL